MNSGSVSGLSGMTFQPADLQAAKQAKPSEDDIALKFEQMLWAEMLSHAGLEDVLTKNGGESAAAFSRFVVESIAADIAEKHPLGLSEAQYSKGEDILK